MQAPNKRPVGRPTKKTPQMIEALLKAIATGAPYRICCEAVGVNLDTFMAWKSSDMIFAAQVEEAAAKTALRLWKKVEEHGEREFQAISWMLERRFPESFSRPEVQLNLIQQNNTVENSLTINITQADAVEIERQAAPVRQAVSEMLRAYRPSSTSSERGNGEPPREIEVQSPALSSVWQPPALSHRETDADNPAFWHSLTASAPERKITKLTAEFAVRTLLVQVAGGNRAQITFDHDPVTIGEVFTRLEKVCGGAAWQLAQKLGGF